MIVGISFDCQTTLIACNLLQNLPPEDLMQMKTDLFEIRLKLCESRKSVPWTMNDLDVALNALKKDKARDPNGWINDIFKDGVA